MNSSVFFLLVLSLLNQSDPVPQTWIRINLLGYQPEVIKVAEWCSKGNETPVAFELVEEATGKAVTLIIMIILESIVLIYFYRKLRN